MIATLATQAEAEGLDVLICSGDRDAFQLDQRPRHGALSAPRRLRPGADDARRRSRRSTASARERYPDLAAMVGESSDNLPGVPGVGPKTAAKWINQFGSLDEIVARVDEIGGKAGESLREQLADVIRNRRINELVRDLDLPVTVDDLEQQPWDRDEVHKIFDGLEFRVLRDRLFETLSADEPQVGEAAALDAHAARRRAKSRAGSAEHAAGDALTGVHVQGSWGGGTGQVNAVALATRRRRAAWIDVAEIDRRRRGRTRRLAGRSRPAQGAARRQGPDARSGGARPAAAGARRRHGACRHTSRTPTSAPTTWPTSLCATCIASSRAATRPPTSSASSSTATPPRRQDAMQRAHAVVDLAAALETELETRGGSRLLADVELPLVDVLASDGADGHRRRRRPPHLARGAVRRAGSSRPPTTPTP